MTLMKLSEVCTIRYGKDHKKLAEGAVPVYGSGGIMRHVEKSLSLGPSVLIPRKGTLGNLFYSDGPFWTVDTLFWTEIKQDIVEPNYLYYALKTKDLASLNIGTAVPSLSTDVLNEVELEVPEKETQKRISTLLGSIEDKIESNAKLNDYLLEYLKAYAKSLYREYERDNSLELPEGWQWVDIGEIAEMVCRGITPKYNEDSDELILGQTCIRNNLVLTENSRLHAPKKVTEKWLKKNDVLINSTGVGSLGRTAQVWFEPSKLVVDSHITIVRTANPKHAIYLGFWVFEHEKFIESLHTGSTGQTELPRDHVKAIRFVLPNEDELDRFNAIAQPAVELIVANQAEIKRLVELRDALLPKLMSGEINVSKVGITQLNNHFTSYFLAQTSVAY